MEKKETAIIAYEKHREWKRRLLAVLLSFAGVCALSRMLKPGGDAIAFTNSIFSVLTFLALYLLMEKVLKASFVGKRRRWILPGLFGTAFSFCMITGVQLDTRGSVPFSDPSLWLAILAGAVVMTLSVRYFWDLIDGKQRERAVSRQKEGEATDQGEKRWNTFSGWFLPSALIFVKAFIIYSRLCLASLNFDPFKWKSEKCSILIFIKLLEFLYIFTQSFQISFHTLL